VLVIECKNELLKMRVRSSELLHHIEWYIVTGVSKDVSASIFRVGQSMKGDYAVKKSDRAVRKE
jgi:hypothetical protein